MDLFSFGRAMAALDGRDFSDEVAKVAGDIQHSLLDVKVARYEGLDIGIKAAPARLVGGDYLDVISRAGKAPILAIGDASGKALPAALRALTLKYLVRGLVAALDDDLARILTLTNAVVCEMVDADEFISLAAFTFVDDCRTLVLANAGHDPPLICRASSGHVESPEPRGLVLGVDSASRYAEQRVGLENGDVLAFYTDGFVEARNPSGEQFTEEKLKTGLLAVRELPAQELADALFARIEAYTAGTFRDDASIIIVRVR